LNIQNYFQVALSFACDLKLVLLQNFPCENKFDFLCESEHEYQTHFRMQPSLDAEANNP